MGERARSHRGCVTALLNEQRAPHIVRDRQKRKYTWDEAKLAEKCISYPKYAKHPKKASDVVVRTDSHTPFARSFLDEPITHAGGAFGPSHATTMDQC